MRPFKTRHTPPTLLPIKPVGELIVEPGRRPIEAIGSCETE